MFEALFGIPEEDAVSALHAATEKLKRDFVSGCFPDVPFSADQAVELGFLAVYFLDGLIKNPSHRSWTKHQEAVAKGYYAACARSWLFDDTIFALLFAPRAEQYNRALADHLLELSQLSAEERFVKCAAIMGEVFAARCCNPSDRRYVGIGAGAIGLLKMTTENLFQSSIR